jgi:hypothetical protein
VRIIRIALLCSHDSPEIRPDISFVVAMLQGILDATIRGCSLSASRILRGCGSEHQVS